LALDQEEQVEGFTADLCFLFPSPNEHAKDRANINRTLHTRKASENLNGISKTRHFIRQVHAEVRINQLICVVAIDVPLLKRVCCVTSGGDEFRPICRGTVDSEALINAWEDDFAR